MTEFEQAVREQTDEVFDLRTDLNARAMMYIASLEEQVERLEKARRLTAQRLEHMKDTDLLAEAYQRVSYEWDNELRRGRSELGRAKALYEEARNDELAAEQALDRLRCNKPGVVQAPAHFTIDENGNAVQTRGDSPGWATQFLQKDEEKKEAK